MSNLIIVSIILVHLIYCYQFSFAFKMIVSNSPSWADLKSKALETPFGIQRAKDEELWAVGLGPPHTDAKLRLFGTNEEPRITLFRDSAAWCPYCQKV